MKTSTITTTPWPQTGDKPFTGEKENNKTTLITPTKNEWELYATGYKTAADILVNDSLTTGRNMDLTIYPITFLYRHYLELRLKEITINGRDLLDTTGKPPSTHKLNELWKECRTILVRIYPNTPQVDLDTVESYILQFSEQDPNSTAFRYPNNIKEESTHKSIKTINVQHLSNTMNRISGLLEGASMAISYHKSIKPQNDLT